MSEELRDELIATIYATPTPIGAFPRPQWPFPVSVTELADAILPVIARERAAAKAEQREADAEIAESLSGEYSTTAHRIAGDRNYSYSEKYFGFSLGMTMAAKAIRAAGTETGENCESDTPQP